MTRHHSSRYPGPRGVANNIPRHQAGSCILDPAQHAEIVHTIQAAIKIQNTRYQVYSKRSKKSSLEEKLQQREDPVRLQRSSST